MSKTAINPHKLRQGQTMSELTDRRDHIRSQLANADSNRQALQRSLAEALLEHGSEDAVVIGYRRKLSELDDVEEHGATQIEILDDQIAQLGLAKEHEAFAKHLQKRESVSGPLQDAIQALPVALDGLEQAIDALQRAEAAFARYHRELMSHRTSPATAQEVSSLESDRAYVTGNIRARLAQCGRAVFATEPEHTEPVDVEAMNQAVLEQLAERDAQKREMEAAHFHGVPGQKSVPL